MEKYNDDRLRAIYDRSDYPGEISFETFERCFCPACSREYCIHREAYRRMPKECGGLGLCPNLEK